MALNQTYIFDKDQWYIGAYTTFEFTATNGEVKFIPLQENTITFTGGGIIRSGICNYGLFGFNGTITVIISNIMCSAQNIIGIDVTVTAVSDTIGTAGFMMEVTGLTNIVTVTVSVLTWGWVEYLDFCIGFYM